MNTDYPHGPSRVVDTAPSGIVSVGNQLSSEIVLYFRESATSLATSAFLLYLSQVNGDTGGYVHLSRDLAFLPYLPSKSGDPVYLYQLMELIDELVSYRDIADELSLAYSQVAGALAFLRRLVQFNAAGVNIDELEDSLIWFTDDTREELRFAVQKG